MIFFYESLIKEYSKDGSRVIKYLNDRKIDREFVDEFKLGFAPDDWNSLKLDARFIPYKDEILVEAGLRKRNEKGNVYDQFRNRLMFPVFDQLGNIVAFSGRTLDDEIPPKYLNSPETSLYKKNQVLYGLYQAMDTIRKTKEIILVEGNVDLITMHKFGFTNTVAICGTAFTENHALLIKRNADRITVLLDGDEAGKKSALKTSEILISNGVNPSIVVLPDESDPDSCLYEIGRNEFEKLLKNSLSLIGLLLLSYDKANKNANYKFDFIKKIFEAIVNINNLNESQEDSLFNEVENMLNIDKNILKRDFSKMIKERSTKKTAKNNDQKLDYVAKNEDMIEFSIIYLMLTDEIPRRNFLSEISEEDFKNKDASRLFLKIYELFEEGEQIKLNNILFDFDEKFKDFMIGFVIEQERAFFPDKEAAESETHRMKIEKAYIDNLSKIKLRKTGDKIKNLTSELKYTDDQSRQNEILGEISGLKKVQKEIIKK